MIIIRLRIVEEAIFPGCYVYYLNSFLSKSYPNHQANILIITNMTGYGSSIMERTN